MGKESGIAMPTREQLAKLDRKRVGKGSNGEWEWVNPHDPDARITKVKHGRTHLAYKAEHAIRRGGQASPFGRSGGGSRRQGLPQQPHAEGTPGGRSSDLYLGAGPRTRSWKDKPEAQQAGTGIGGGEHEKSCCGKSSCAARAAKLPSRSQQSEQTISATGC